jgi:ABC-type Fe3+/spermidine/putrescine transport system ATPase subunit
VVGAGLTAGRAVELSIRPESIVMHSANGTSPDAPGALRARVEQVAYLGGSVQYQVRTQGGLSMTVLVPRGGERRPIGTDVEIAWSPTEALVLGPATDQEETGDD